jgi:hypothetical protein
MKNLIIIFALLSILNYSCTQEEVRVEDSLIKKDTIRTSVNDLKFKLYPTATDQFTFSILNQRDKTYKLYLKKGNKEVANYLLAVEANNSSVSSTVVKYNFSPNDVYRISIQAIRETKDTVFQEEFTINANYTHKYFNKFNYEKLASITQTLDFDISPSRNVIFYLDYISNKFVLKRLSLTDKKLEVLDDNFFSLMIRSKSDHQLITTSGKYNNRYLKADSCAVLNYDVNTHETSFIDWGSEDYGRFSRVVNNSIMVSNPISTNSVSLINLSDNSKKKYPADMRYLSEYSFNQIFLGGKMLNFTNFTFENRLPFLNSNSSIAYYDDNSQYYITVEYFQDSQSLSFYSRMIIYKDNKIVCEQPFEKGRSFNFPGIIDLKDNKLIYFQSYDYDSSIRFDGYYLLDIATKETTLLQNDNNNYVKFDFFGDSNKNSFISVRPYEIYKITMK